MTFELNNLNNPFQIRNLSVLAYANGFTMWHYKSQTYSKEILSLNYFADAKDMMAKGDMIVSSSSDGGIILFVVSTEDSVVVSPL